MDNSAENSVASPDNSEQLPENPVQLPDNSQELPTNEEKAEKRARGRPKGSKDTVPRRPRVVIVEQSPEPDPPPPPKPKERKPREREPVYHQPPQPPEPPSPRTVFRQASESLAALQDQREQARRAYWQDAIARSLR
jgi:hypothetical protein